MVQGANALIPVVVFPYLIIQHGVVQFALYANAEVLSLIVLVVSVYSFDVDALRRVVGRSLPSDADIIGRAFSEVLTARLILFSVSTVLLVAVVWLFAGGELAILIGLWALIPLGYCLQSLWLFQALEMTLALGCFAVLGRFGSVVATFLTVDPASNPYMVPLILGLGSVVAGIGPVVFLMARDGLRYRVPALGSIIRMMKEGRHVFYMNLSVMGYRDLNVLILSGIGVGAAGISAYALAEKYVKCLQAIVRPVNQVYFPQIIRLLKGTTSPGWGVVRRLGSVAVPQFAAAAFLMVMFWLAVTALLGAKDSAMQWGDVSSLEPAMQLANVMILAVLFGVPNFVFGVAGLSQIGAERDLFQYTFITAIFSIIVCGVGAWAYEESGAVLAFVGAEVFLLVLILSRYRRDFVPPVS